MSRRQTGYTLVELLITVLVASVVLAATLASYTIVSDQHARMSSRLDLQQQGGFAIEALRSHIRQANYMNPDTIQPNPITNYAVVVDRDISVGSDSLTVAYDVDENNRICVFFNVVVDAATNIAQLFETRGVWQGAGPICNYAGSVPEPLVSNVETLQIQSISNPAGRTILIDVFLLLSSSRFQFNQPNFLPPLYEPGMDPAFAPANAQNTLQSFSASIFLRNVRQP